MVNPDSAESWFNCREAGQDSASDTGAIFNQHSTEPRPIEPVELMQLKPGSERRPVEPVWLNQNSADPEAVISLPLIGHQSGHGIYSNIGYFVILWSGHGSQRWKYDIWATYGIWKSSDRIRACSRLLFFLEKWQSRILEANCCILEALEFGHAHGCFFFLKTGNLGF